MKVPIVALAALLSLAVNAQDAKPRQFQYNGVGTHSCGQYLSNTRGVVGGDAKLLYQQWGAGFLAGASNEGSGGNPVADGETIAAWLDKWCAEDPASRVIQGVIALGKRTLTKP